MKAPVCLIEVEELTDEEVAELLRTASNAKWLNKALIKESLARILTKLAAGVNRA